MFCWVLLQQVLEVWRASAQDHLVGLGMLTLNSGHGAANAKLYKGLFTSVAIVTSQKLFSV